MTVPLQPTTWGGLDNDVVYVNPYNGTLYVG